MNSVYQSFKQNSENKYMNNFSDLQDVMREKSIGAFAKKDGANCNVGIIICESGNIRNSVKQRIVFQRNEKIASDNYNKIGLLNQAAAITQSNIEYVSSDSTCQCLNESQSVKPEVCDKCLWCDYNYHL